MPNAGGAVLHCSCHESATTGQGGIRSIYGNSSMIGAIGRSGGEREI